MYSPERMRAVINYVIAAAVLRDVDLTDQDIHTIVCDGDLAIEAMYGQTYTGETYVDGPNGPVGMHIQQVLDEIDDELTELEDTLYDKWEDA